MLQNCTFSDFKLCYFFLKGVIDKMHVPTRALHLQAPGVVDAPLPLFTVSTAHPHPTEQVYEGSRINVSHTFY
jgi:hypothetical protein